MVEFYAPWCGHCQALAPEYASAASKLKGENIILAKVDATEENELAQEYDIQGFPTVYLFIDGVHKPYNGHGTKDAIVSWIKKKIGPGIYNITTLDDAERTLTSESKVVLGFLNSLVVIFTFLAWGGYICFPSFMLVTFTRTSNQMQVEFVFLLLKSNAHLFLKFGKWN